MFSWILGGGTTAWLIIIWFVVNWVGRGMGWGRGYGAGRNCGVFITVEGY